MDIKWPFALSFARVSDYVFFIPSKTNVRLHKTRKTGNLQKRNGCFATDKIIKAETVFLEFYWGSYSVLP